MQPGATGLGATLSHFLPKGIWPPRLLAPLADEGFVMSLLLFPEPGLDFFSLMFRNSQQLGRCPAAGSPHRLLCHQTSCLPVRHCFPDTQHSK